MSASMAELHAGEPVTIGVPLPNYALLVIAPDVEQGLRLLPRGEVGELCITGPGVASGYLGRPDLTAEKFLANPWSSGAQRRSALPHRRSGAHRRRRARAVPRPHRRPGQDPRLSGRARRDRGRAGAAAGRRHCGRGAAPGRRRRPVDRLPGGRERRRRCRRRHCARRSARGCRPTWCPAASRCCRRCRA